jgi:sulfate permease, SulP family
MRLSLSRPAFIAQLDNYQEGWLRSDISAGLAIAAVGLPSAIAYPAIAGLPPESGFYASITPLIVYALFGPSRQLIVGPDVATTTLLAAVLTAVFPTPGCQLRLGCPRHARTRRRHRQDRPSDDFRGN